MSHTVYIRLVWVDRNLVCLNLYLWTIIPVLFSASNKCENQIQTMNPGYSRCCIWILALI